MSVCPQRLRRPCPQSQINQKIYLSTTLLESVGKVRDDFISLQERQFPFQRVSRLVLRGGAARFLCFLRGLGDCYLVHSIIRAFPSKIELKTGSKCHSIQDSFENFQFALISGLRDVTAVTFENSKDQFLNRQTTPPKHFILDKTITFIDLGKRRGQ